MTPQRILELADEVEARVEGGPAPRPLMRCAPRRGVCVKCGAGGREGCVWPAGAAAAAVWRANHSAAESRAHPPPPACASRRHTTGTTTPATPPCPQRAAHLERRVLGVLPCAPGGLVAGAGAGWEVQGRPRPALPCLALPARLLGAGCRGCTASRLPALTPPPPCPHASSHPTPPSPRRRLRAGRDGCAPEPGLLQAGAPRCWAGLCGALLGRADARGLRVCAAVRGLAGRRSSARPRTGSPHPRRSVPAPRAPLRHPPSLPGPQKFGRIVDEPRVGQELADTYWAPGNGEPFLDLVKKVGKVGAARRMGGAGQAGGLTSG